MKVVFVEDYKQYKKGDELEMPEFALEEYFGAGVVKLAPKPKAKPKPEPKAKPESKTKPRAKPKAK